MEAYKGRKLSKNEQVLMDKLTYNPETATELRYDLTNGFGVLNLDNLTSFDLPKPQFDKERKEKKGGFLFDKLVNIQKVGEGIRRTFGFVAIQQGLRIPVRRLSGSDRDNPLGLWHQAPAQRYG